MEMLFVFGLLAFLSLGLISLGEVIFKAFQPKPETPQQPLDYTHPAEAAGEGLLGLGTESNASGSWLEHVISAIAHVFHH